MENHFFYDKTKYIEAIGLNTIILLSKELFPNNEDIKNYTNNNFDIEIKEYLFKSRTMLVARTNRYIYGLNAEQLQSIYKHMTNFLNQSVVEEHADNEKKKNKSKENLKTWLKNI